MVKIFSFAVLCVREAGLAKEEAAWPVDRSRQADLRAEAQPRLGGNRPAAATSEALGESQCQTEYRKNHHKMDEWWMPEGGQQRKEGTGSPAGWASCLH